MEPDRLENNKRAVARLFEVLYGVGDDLDVLDELIAEDYVQHSPLAGQGRDGVKRFFKEKLIPLPYRLEPREVNLIPEGDFVVRQELRAHRYSGMLVDIFRVEGGLIREHWDAYRPDPGTERMPGF